MIIQQRKFWFSSFLLLILFRLALVVRAEPVFDLYDSPRYFEFELINAFRLPIITGIYSFITNHQGIVIFQNLLSSFAWILLFLSLQRFLTNYRYKCILFISIFFFSCTQIVIFRDVYLTSESLNLSLTVILISLYLLNNQFKYRVLLIAIVIFLVSGIKNQNAFFAVPILLLLFHSFSKNTQTKSKLRLFSSIGVIFSLLGSSYFLYLSLNDSTISTLNTAAHVNFRIWTHEPWKEQLLESGYPPELRTIWRDFYSYNRGKPPSQAVADEQIFKDWWNNSGGNSFLVSFTLKNIDYLLIGPFFLPTLNKNANYSHTISYGIAQDPNYYPKLNEIYNPANLFWPESRANSYLAVAIYFIILGSLYIYLSRNKQYGELLTKTSVVFILLLVWNLLSWYLASKLGIDILRNSETLAIMTRLFSIFFVILWVENFFAKHWLSLRALVGRLGLEPRTDGL